MQKFTTFLLFVGEQYGKAEEAMNFYISVFSARCENSSDILKIERYGPGEIEKEGMVKHAVFTLDGQEFMATESGLGHSFTFTPAMSIFVTCESEAEVDELFGRLSQGGRVHMPLDKYPFSRKFAWVEDRYGVSWQLSLGGTDR